jgi:hypothetical protein
MSSSPLHSIGLTSAHVNFSIPMLSHGRERCSAWRASSCCYGAGFVQAELRIGIDTDHPDKLIVDAFSPLRALA